VQNLLVNKDKILYIIDALGALPLLWQQFWLPSDFPVTPSCQQQLEPFWIYSRLKPTQEWRQPQPLSTLQAKE
jgi:hypothetical protein